MNIDDYRQMRDNLCSIVDSLPYLTSVIPQPPLLDMEGGLFGGGDGGIVGIKNFRSGAQKDIDGLDNYISQHLNTPDPLPPLSTNAPYILAVWGEIIAACSVQAIGKTFNLPKEKGRGKDAGTVKVDVVADEGRRWIRVNTIKNSRLMAEIHELDGYDSESSEENSQNGNIVTTPSENSIIRMAKSLLAAAKNNIVPDTGEAPQITLRLTRLETDPTNSDGPIDHRIVRTMTELEAMGVDIQLGERPFPPRLVAPTSPPPTPPRPTRRINLDLSLIIALVSDLTHAPLPASEAEAYERFKPLTRVWKSGKLFRSTVINTSEFSSDEEGEDETNQGKDVVKDSHEHSRALALQLLSEMRHSLLDEMATYLKVNGQPLEFWTTPEAQQRCAKIVQKIGGVGERRRARALFDPDGQQVFWEGSRFGGAFIPELVPLRVYPQHVPTTTTLSASKPTTSYEIFARRLFRTCRILLSPSHVEVQARLKGTDVPLGYATELGPPSDMPLAPSIDTGTPSPSVLAGSRPNTRLTAHTVRSMLWGVSSRVTTLTANRASVRAVLREMKILAGIGTGVEDVEGVTPGHVGSGSSVCGKEREVGEDGIAVLWVVEPRSLAEQMRSDVVSAGEGVNA